MRTRQAIREIIAEGFDERRAEWKSRREADRKRADSRTAARRRLRATKKLQGFAVNVKFVQLGCDSEEHF